MRKGRTDPVNIGVNVLRQVVVDDVRDLLAVPLSKTLVARLMHRRMLPASVPRQELA